MPFALGIDLGSNHVAVAIVDTATRLPVATASQPLDCRVRSVVPGGVELDVDGVLATVALALANLPPESRKAVGCIGVTGQMHGVMLWHGASHRRSRFITWQDRRAEGDGFLVRLRERTRDSRLSSGYGCVTLAWLQSYEAEAFDGYDRSGTLSDFLVAWMCDSSEARMDPVMAHSWGMFDLQQRSFSEGRCKRAGVPMKVLPTLADSGSRAGSLGLSRAVEWGLPPGIPVAVATGDNPASIYATLRDPEHEISLNIGTAAQLGVVVPMGATLPAATIPSVEYRPYLDDRVLVVAATQVGGEAIAWLVHTLRDWIVALGLEPPSDDAIYAQVNNLGLHGLTSRTAPAGLEAVPAFRGERNNPNLDGKFSGISMENFTIANVSVALGQGMLQHVMSIMPEELLASRRCVVCTGNGIRQSQMMRRLVVDAFGLPISVPAFREEAATGVALLAADHQLPTLSISTD